MDTVYPLLRNALNAWEQDVALDRHLRLGPPPEAEELRERFTGFRRSPIYDAMIADASPVLRVRMEFRDMTLMRPAHILVPEGLPAFGCPTSIYGIPVHVSPLVPPGRAYLINGPLLPASGSPA